MRAAAEPIRASSCSSSPPACTSRAEFGYTIAIARDDGFAVDETVDIAAAAVRQRVGDRQIRRTRRHRLRRCVRRACSPISCVVLGDRYETFAAAHGGDVHAAADRASISGGDVTEGAIDEWPPPRHQQNVASAFRDQRRIRPAACASSARTPRTFTWSAIPASTASSTTEDPGPRRRRSRSRHALRASRTCSSPSIR